MARRSPKLGEVIAFRNVVQRIPVDTAVDEISIQAVVAQQRLRLVYDPDAIVYNKGPMTVRDFLKQRRRIHAGHVKIRTQENYEASTMKVGPIVREIVTCASYTIRGPRAFIWTLGTIALEGLARSQGQYDVMNKHSHHIWQAVASTKMLEDEQRKLRRIAKGQSVITFQVKRESVSGTGLHDLADTRTIRASLYKLLPSLRKYVRKDDLLSLHGNNVLVAVLQTEHSGADLVAQRLVKLIEAQAGRHTRGRIPLQITYHTVSFAR
jgi:hypothetical protein